MTVAARALACLDLTDLSDGASAADTDTLCQRARTRHGPVAAVCLWPRHVAQAKRRLAGTGIKVATVVNFPSGVQPAAEVLAETEAALAAGADEIDLVIPWPMLLEGHPENVHARVARVKALAGERPVKAILETGQLQGAATIREAATLALEGGADFLKTSTGKVPVGATPEAARILLEAVKAADGAHGVKISGGVRTVEDAAQYLAIADEVMGPDWAGPATFRFGASGLLSALTGALEGRAPAAPGKGY